MKANLHPALKDLLQRVQPAETGIKMDSIGNWSCAKLGLRGYGTLRQLQNAIAKKKAKLGIK